MIKFLSCFYQSKITLINKVVKRKAFVLVLFGYRNHKTQIGLHQLLQCSFIAILYPLCQLHFLLGSDHLYLVNVLKIFL